MQIKVCSSSVRFLIKFCRPMCEFWLRGSLDTYKMYAKGLNKFTHHSALLCVRFLNPNSSQRSRNVMPIS